MQLLFEVQQLFAFTLHHTRYGNTRPAAHHFSDIICGHLLANQRVAVLGIGELGLDALNVIFERLQLRVADFGHLPIVALALSTLSLVFQVLHLLLILLDLIHQLALTLPLGTELGFLFAEFCNLLVQLGNLRLIAFAFDGFAFNLKLCQATGDLIELLRDGVTLHTELGGSFVHQVDSLVGQETLRDITL